ncbi:MAG: RHS repeat-associated core domain-containing protein [Pseudomonas sp.]
MLPSSVLSSIRSNPLDRLSANCQSAQTRKLRFYLKDRMTTEVGSDGWYSVFQHRDHLLAEQVRQGTTADTCLLASDRLRSVLHTLGPRVRHSWAFTPYGYCLTESSPARLLAFNGERRESETGHYLLGNGYRAFNPLLMRFNSTDSWSPFGEGGVNSYAYCQGDPVNLSDPSGHILEALVPHFNAIPTGALTVLATAVPAASTAANYLGRSISPRWLYASGTAALSGAASISLYNAARATVATQALARPIAMVSLAVGGAVAVRVLSRVILPLIRNVTRTTSRVFAYSASSIINALETNLPATSAFLDRAGEELVRQPRNARQVRSMV